MTIKVLIVDDSALIRRLLTRVLESDPQIKVVGTAVDPYDAREKIKQLDPDVLTLDVELPKMNGIAFLKNLMRLRPMPVVMVSSYTEQGTDVTLQALEIGAVDFVTKPRGEPVTALQRLADELVSKVKIAANSRLARNKRDPDKTKELADTRERFSADVILPADTSTPTPKRRPTLVAIGASTGGTEAIKEVLVGLPKSMPPIVVTQHIPAGFSNAFARRMNHLALLEVHEAEEDQLIEPGHVYIAPGSHHLLVTWDGQHYRCKLNDGPRVNRHKPSVDVLFRSVAQCCGANAIGVILTGMGDDGARCLLEMRQAGARTIAQDEESSVVWGMPGAAVKRGAAEMVLPLSAVPGELVKLLSDSRGRTGATCRRAP